MGELRTWTPDEYHADPCDRPSLSASIATTLLTRSPLHAWTQHPRLGGVRRTPTKAMEGGTLIHALLLGGKEIVPVDADSYRTNAAKEARDAATAAGKIPVLADKLGEPLAVAEMIRKRLGALGIALDGVSEQAVTWTEQTAHGEITCRGMMDHVIPERGVIYDLKTIASADLDTCERHAIRYGYDVQATAYTRALEAVRPALLGRVDYVWLFCETVPPYAVTAARPDGSLREMGLRRWDRACDTWSWCLKTDTWPAYFDQVVSLSAPAWALSKEMDAAMEEEAAQ